MNIPIYKIVINEFDESGCTTISLVENPAVELPFLCFDKQEKINLAVDDEKRIISGIAMLADTPIYRCSPSRGEHYIVFTKETVLKMVEKYAKNGLYNLVNLQHQEDTYVTGIHMIESLIIDKERGICPAEFSDVADGSWYVSFHVENDDLWEAIKTSGLLNGFSIELLSDLELMEKQINKDNDMNKFFRLAKMIMKFTEIKTDKETLIIEGELEVGKTVVIETEEGPVEAADGEYTLEDGTVIVIEGAVITEIRGVDEPEVKEVIEPLAEEEKVVDEPENTENDELKARIAELEAIIAERDARIAELEAELVEKDEKLKMSVETPITKKTLKNIDNKALKYFE